MTEAIKVELYNQPMFRCPNCAKGTQFIPARGARWTCAFCPFEGRVTSTWTTGFTMEVVSSGKGRPSGGIDHE